MMPLRSNHEVMILLDPILQVRVDRRRALDEQIGPFYLPTANL